MAAITKLKNSANERNVENILKDIKEWNKKLQNSSPTLTFLSQFITADIFQKDHPNLFENLFTYSTSLRELKTEKIELHQELINHKNDINGMLECEDISCETFYYSRHEKLGNRLQAFFSNFSEFQTEFFKFCNNKLRKTD